MAKPKADEKKVETPVVTEEVKAKIIEEAVPDIKEEIRSEIVDDIKEEREITKKEAKDEAVKAAQEDLQKKLTGEPEEEKTPWTKEGRQPRDYDEVAEVIKKQTLTAVEAQEAKKVAEQAKAAKDEKASEAKTEKKWTEHWETQLRELVEEKKIPGVSEDIQRKMDKGQTLTAEDRQDPGVVARAEIWEAAKENKERNLRLVYFEHIKDKSDVGGDAPVFGSRRAAKPAEEKTEYTYEETRDDSIDEILRGG